MKYPIVFTTALAISVSAVAVAQKPSNFKSKPVASKKMLATTLITLNKLKAFPTAEGAGANAKGGRNGRVVYVTNRNTGGPGSLKAALKATGSRTIVFALGGRFNIDEKIYLGGNNVTLAGQTANALGGVHLTSEFNICDSEKSFNINNKDDVVLRYFDSRYNWQYMFMADDSVNNCPDDYRWQHLPTLRFTLMRDFIIDHVSSGWSSYGIIATNLGGGTSMAATGNITIQRSLMHENSKNHQNHNVGMLLGTASSRGQTKEQWNNIGDYSIHKNAFIGISHRVPNIAGGDNAKFRVINNYIYGFMGDSTGRRLSRIGGNSKNDFVNNTYQEATYGAKFVIDGSKHTGPNANNLLGFQYGSFLPMKEEDGYMRTPDYNIIEKPNFYIDGNLFLNDQGNELDITSSIQSDKTLMTFRYHAYDHDFAEDGINRKESNLDGDHLQFGPRDNLILRNNPLSMTDALEHPVLQLAAKDVKTDILSNVGANVRFHQDGSTYIADTIDKKYIVDWAQNNAGPNKITTSPDDGGVGSRSRFEYPDYNSTATSFATPNGLDVLASYDKDKDGMPNAWEIAHQLDFETANNNNVSMGKIWDFGSYKVVNNAGYTDLEMYLADVAGDFHMLAKTEGVPINSNTDDLISINMLSEVEAGSTVDVAIEYAAKTERQLKCYFQELVMVDLDEKWRTRGFNKVNVEAGSGTATCHVNIPGNISEQSETEHLLGDYRMFAYLTETNGRWSKRKDTIIKTDLSIKSVSDDLVSIDMPSVVEPNSTVDVSLQYVAGADRQIKCYFQEYDTSASNPKWVTQALSINNVEQGSGTSVCKIDIPRDIGATQNARKSNLYRLYAYITESNGRWSKRKDSITKTDITINDTKDLIVSVDMPSVLTAGDTIDVPIKYLALADRQIKCFLRDDQAPWTVHSFWKGNVQAGSGVPELDYFGTTDCKVKVPENLSVNGTYQLYVYITELNGRWSLRKDTFTKQGITVNQ